LGIRYLDNRYRRVFQNLFRKQWDQWFDSKNFSGESITLVIGSLGAGGSERQAVTTLLGLASGGYCDLSLLCTHLGADADRFYAHLLDGAPVAVSEATEGFNSADDNGEVNRETSSLGLRLLFNKLPSELDDITWYAREFLARKPKVVHTWLDYTNVKAGVAAAIVGVPRIVLSTRSLAPTQFDFFQPYMREAYRALAVRPSVCLLNNSEAGARDYERWLGLPHGTFKVVRNGFDFSGLEREKMAAPAREMRVRLGIPPDVPLVGSALRFSNEKCPFLWLEIAAHVAERRPEVMFLMVGDGPLWEDARRRAQACGMSNRMVMPGNEKNAAAAIAAMDVFLLTSRVEGLPNVLVEAQALGVPVVTTDVGGAAETLIPGMTGFTVASQSVEVLANAVLQVLDDRAWRETARTVAQKFVRERFSMSQMISGTLDAYFERGEFANARDVTNNSGRAQREFVIDKQNNRRA
jgi:glycosyltransferase involved in cell wall biosynthesis